eukprot:TRINITY_DN4194_c0_g1_i1.p1 TRINITY_DN4194_c0_g1~~TRINITY_DN4194_c0_g1_i1.p1  ORF type:complete len:240 (+),score=63.43 TRINITY_DN4194_c0_g1_i1:129-848(+)
MKVLSPFKKVRIGMKIYLSPFWSGKVSMGIKYHLDQFIFRYIPEFSAVMVSHDNLEVLDRAGLIMDENPFVLTKIKVDFLLFAPALHSFIIGTVNNVGVDHIGLLIFRTFNASIGSQNLGGNFKLDFSSGTWTDQGTGAQIAVGTDIVFEIINIHQENHILSIVGSMLKEGTGIVTSKKYKQFSEGLQRSSEELLETKYKAGHRKFFDADEADAGEEEAEAANEEEEAEEQTEEPEDEE